MLAETQALKEYAELYTRQNIIVLLYYVFLYYYIMYFYMHTCSRMHEQTIIQSTNIRVEVKVCPHVLTVLASAVIYTSLER